ncbi:MAG: hypothetical protein CML06_06300 [Pseudomonadales bacterium]|nr:hypothetical protein [Pseudomonadales bacterium]
MQAYETLAVLHLGTVVPAFFIGTFLLFRRKGDRAHRALGQVYMLLMLITATLTLFMPARVGPTLLSHFGYIHLFSLSVFILVPSAYLAVRSGNRRLHAGNMLGLYLGGLVVAGAFAMTPGRMLYRLLIMG